MSLNLFSQLFDVSSLVTGGFSKVRKIDNLYRFSGLNGSDFWSVRPYFGNFGSSLMSILPASRLRADLPSSFSLSVFPIWLAWDAACLSLFPSRLSILPRQREAFSVLVVWRPLQRPSFSRTQPGPKGFARLAPFSLHIRLFSNPSQQRDAFFLPHIADTSVFERPIKIPAHFEHRPKFRSTPRNRFIDFRVQTRVFEITYPRVLSIFAKILKFL